MSEDTADSRKRKLNYGVSEKALKMMRTMGYESGMGLGAHSQGITEPVNVSKQKGRRGFGLVPKSEVSAHATGHLYKSTDPSLVWQKDNDEASADSDKIWFWKPDDDDGRGRRSNLTALSTMLISPDDVKSIGPPIRQMDDQFNFCSQHVLRELLAYKNQLDDVSKELVTDSHQRCNPYELIKKGIFMNRAAMKLANMDSILDGLLTNTVAPDEIMYFADVCAGPGGFSEYLLWRRCNSILSHSSSTSNSVADERPSSNTPHLSAKGFGLTLTGECDFRLNDFLAGPSEAFFPHYGTTKDGDITKWTNLASFSSLIDQATSGQGVHLLVADGGFDVSGQHNLQEVLSKRIYLCQCLCALIVLQPGGLFLTKLFDLFTEFSVGLIYLIGQLFEEVVIIKPVTSRPANSERYLLCKNLRSPLKGMAGCPPSPKNDQKSSDSRPKAQKLPGRGRLQNDASSDAGRKYGVLDREQAGALGEVIEYLLRVNEKLGSLHSPSNNHSADCPKQDILRLFDTNTLLKDLSFNRFITRMNKEFAIQQCIALSKLLAFAHDLRLSDSRQMELKIACLERWKVDAVERKPVPWPLMTSNRSSVIHDLIGDKERLKSINLLPKDYYCQYRTERFNNRHLAMLDYLIGSRIALVCGSPSMTTESVPSKPMLIYSRGRLGNLVSVDGENWQPLEQVTQHCCPPLPPGTLIWAQSTCEYSAKNGNRRHALYVFDVACIYGYDCRKLSYRERMSLAQRMCEVINFPNMRSSYVRVPPMLSLRDLPGFVKQLQKLPCKDESGLVPMHLHAGGMLFRPYSILLVEHLAEPWTELVSRSTGQLRYFNSHTSESTFTVPPDQVLSFTQTHFLKIPWISAKDYDISVPHLIDNLEPFLQASP